MACCASSGNDAYLARLCQYVPASSWLLPDASTPWHSFAVLALHCTPFQPPSSYSKNVLMKIEHISEQMDLLLELQVCSSDVQLIVRYLAFNVVRGLVGLDGQFILSLFECNVPLANRTYQ